MFSIERIVLVNFRSFIGTHVFEFPTDPGLYNLTGKNLVNPRLGANATGKSTLLDAIYWCLYGRTTRGLRGGDVVSWGEKGCAVAVTLWIGDLKWTIRRGQNPNSLTWLDHNQLQFPVEHATDQATIDRYLQLTAEAFLYSVILPQFGESFFDLSPSEKLGLFSAIMELDSWLERSQAADQRAKGLMEQKNKQEQTLARAEGQLQFINEDLTSLGDKEKGFADKQSQLIVEMETELQALVIDLKKISEDMKFAAKGLLIAEEKIAKMAGKGICPTCKQNVPNDDLKSVTQNRADFQGRLDRLKQQHSSNKRTQDALRLNIAKEVSRTNPYKEMITAKKQSLSDLKDKVKVIKSQINATTEEHAAVSFWIGGFKRVRLFIVEEALRQLEIEVNNNLASLGLTEWRIEFDVERENKSGGITKGFTVMIYPPGAEEPVRYESYSGGETQRLRLAGDLGLANLIMERAGLSNTIEFYDEPSRHMNPEGLSDLAETLAQRATAQGKRVFLVEHHAVDFSGFADTYTVSKGERGSFL